MSQFPVRPWLLAAVLAAASLLTAPASAHRIECGGTYVVVPGDTLSGIAASVPGAPLDRMIEWIMRANAGIIASADLIFPGQEIYVPCDEREALLRQSGKGDVEYLMLQSSAAEASSQVSASVVQQLSEATVKARRVEQGMQVTAGIAGPQAAIAAMPSATATDSAAAIEPAAGPVEGGRATRIFSGPGQYPPTSFGGYAIVAFKSQPLAGEGEDFERYRYICEAYVRSIPEASGDAERQRSELVTVWPLSGDDVARQVMQLSREMQCQVASWNYGIEMALQAIRDARKVSRDLADDFAEREGPFLLAWNPASKKGEPDALILRVDLSWVQSPAQAKDAFGFWVQRIETNTDLWLDDWETRPLDQIVANTADNWGQAIIDSVAFLVGGGE